MLCLAAAACGGGGGGNNSNTTSYPFVVPAVGSQRNFSQTTVDNASNTVAETYSDKILAVNSDGTFVAQTFDPSGTVIVVNGVTYSIPTRTTTVDPSGRDLSYTFVQNSGAVSCVDNPNGAGPTYPVSVGAAWSSTWTLTCNAAAGVAYQQSGTIVDLESVTIPAGTFKALKLQSTVTWTSVSGTTVTETITRWRDSSNGQGVKEVDAFAYSSPPATPAYTVSKTIELVGLQ